MSDTEKICIVLMIIAILSLCAIIINILFFKEPFETVPCSTQNAMCVCASGFIEEGDNCIEKPSRIPAPEIPRFPLLYQISTRQWLYELAQKYPDKQKNGIYLKLSAVPDEEFERIRDLGFNVIWFTGIWSLGKYALYYDKYSGNKIGYFEKELPGLNREVDIIGSPFAITSYTVNPDIGTKQDLENLVNKLHSLGMQLCLDFVPNHTAIDSPWVKDHPQYYIELPQGKDLDYDFLDPNQGNVDWLEGTDLYETNLTNGRTFAHGKDPYSGAWKDTLQLNYWNNDVRKFMEEQLNYVASFADMVRVDMAHLLINDVFEATWASDSFINTENILGPVGIRKPDTEFWPGVITRLKQKYPKFKLMAEVYRYDKITKPYGYSNDQKLKEFGFDFTYEKEVTDMFSSKIKVGGYVNLNSGEAMSSTVHFVENHDEPRAIEKFDGVPQSFIGAIAALTLPGLRLVHHGQLEGKTTKLGVHLLRTLEPFNYKNEYVYAFYEKFLKILSTTPAFQGGWSIAENGNNNLLVYNWVNGNEDSKLIVAMNLSSFDSQWTNVYVRDATYGDNRLDDLFQDGESYARDGSSNNIGIGLSGYNCQILQYY